MINGIHISKFQVPVALDDLSMRARNNMECLVLAIR
jgi:hypothetical protein